MACSVAEGIGRSLEEQLDQPVFDRPEESELFERVMALPKKYRLTVYLYYYEGYSIKEIANLLRLPVPTVGTRLSRGRERLRQILKEDVE